MTSCISKFHIYRGDNAISDYFFINDSFLLLIVMIMYCILDEEQFITASYSVYKDSLGAISSLHVNN